MTKLFSLFQVVVVWVPLGCSLDWFGAYAMVWFGLPLPELWVWYYVVGVLVDQYVKVWFGMVSLCPGCGLSYIWVVCLLASVFVCCGLMPLSYF